MDLLLGEGVKFETAGSLQGGRKVWMLARMPENYRINGDDVCPYLVFTTSHDGSSGIRAAITPVRVVCRNTLNLALQDASRIWATPHVGDMKAKLDEARKTLLLAEYYMGKLQNEAQVLSGKSISEKKALEIIDELLPMPEHPGTMQIGNIKQQRNDLTYRYVSAPDLSNMPQNGWRMINAVSDYANHAFPIRMTLNHQESRFTKAIEGHNLLDKAYEILHQL